MNKLLKVLINVDRRKRRVISGAGFLLIIVISTLAWHSHRVGTGRPVESALQGGSESNASDKTEQFTSEIQQSLNLLAKSNIGPHRQTAVELANAFVNLQIGLEHDSQEKLEKAVAAAQDNPALGNRHAAEAVLNNAGFSGSEVSGMMNALTSNMIKVPGVWRKVDSLHFAVDDFEAILGYYLIHNWDGTHFENSIETSWAVGSPYYYYVIYQSVLPQYSNLTVLLIKDKGQVTSVLVFLLGDKAAPIEGQNFSEACGIISSCIFLTKGPGESSDSSSTPPDGTCTRGATIRLFQDALQKCSSANTSSLTTEDVDTTFNSDYMDVTFNRVMVQGVGQPVPLYVFVMSAPMNCDE